jgi:hypothetical protein
LYFLLVGLVDSEEIDEVAFFLPEEREQIVVEDDLAVKFIAVVLTELYDAIDGVLYVAHF